jgi:hypothetical protein
MPAQTKVAHIHVRTEQDMKNRIAKIGADERRNESQVVNLLLAEALDAREARA